MSCKLIKMAEKNNEGEGWHNEMWARDPQLAYQAKQAEDRLEL